MSKKILSVMLALVFVISTFAVSAFAVGDIAVDPEASTKTQAWALGEPSKEAPYTVDVTLDANYKVGAIQFKVVGADAVLTDVALNADLFGEDWETNYDVDFTEDGLVIIVPTPGSAAKQGPDLTGGKKIVTLTYELAEGKSSATIAIDNDPKKEDNIGGSLIAVRMSDDSLTTGTLYYGQTVLSVGQTRTLGSAAAADPELVAKAGSTGCVDADRMYVYGVPADTAVANFNTYFEATNGGVFDVSANGTGATLTLYKDNSKATVVAEYTVIIFGDVNGDGSINVTDSNMVSQDISGQSVLGGCYSFAGDVSPDNVISVTDTNIISQHISGNSLIAANVRA